MDQTRPDQRRILQAAAVAAVLSGAPSTTWALAGGGPAAAVRGALDSTRAAGTLLPGRTPGLIRGAVAHALVSVAVAEAIAPLLAGRRAIRRGAALGLAAGVVNLTVVAPRRYPAIAALALGPQLADNVAFGAVMAASLGGPRAGVTVGGEGGLAVRAAIALRFCAAAPSGRSPGSAGVGSSAPGGSRQTPFVPSEQTATP